MSKVFLAHLIGGLSILCAQAPLSAAPTSSGMKTILVLGDSLSDGFQLQRSEAYPALIANKLRAAGLILQVTNASATGGTTEGGLERLPPHLKRRIDIFILELGINDAFRGVPVEQIQNNLQQIIDRVKARNPDVRVVIAGMQLPNYGADDYVSAFGKMFGELATKKWRRTGAVSPRGRGRRSFAKSVGWHSSQRRRSEDFGRKCLACTRTSCARDSRRAIVAR